MSSFYCLDQGQNINFRASLGDYNGLNLFLDFEPCIDRADCYTNEEIKSIVKFLSQLKLKYGAKNSKNSLLFRALLHSDDKIEKKIYAIFKVDIKK